MNFRTSNHTIEVSRWIILQRHERVRYFSITCNNQTNFDIPPFFGWLAYQGHAFLCFYVGVRFCIICCQIYWKIYQVFFSSLVWPPQYIQGFWGFFLTSSSLIWINCLFHLQLCCVFSNFINNNKTRAVVLSFYNKGT